MRNKTLLPTGGQKTRVPFACTVRVIRFNVTLWLSYGLLTLLYCICYDVGSTPNALAIHTSSQLNSIIRSQQEVLRLTQ